MNTAKELMDLYKKSIDLAINLGKTKKKNQKELVRLISEISIEVNKTLIGYDCLKQAVMLSNDKLRILKDTENFITNEIERISNVEKSEERR